MMLSGPLQSPSDVLYYKVWVAIAQGLNATQAVMPSDHATYYRLEV